MNIKFLLHICCFAVIQVSLSQLNTWSKPISIDSTNQIQDALIAVSPTGEIAVVCYSYLYMSYDNGKSFHLKHVFKPPLSPSEPYWVFMPNGLEFDSNGVLYFYWAWDWCEESTCTFTKERYLYLSRSFDKGNSFENILIYPGAQLISNNTRNDPKMLIDRDNTIHLLRDSLWYNGNTTDHFLIYVNIKDGNVEQRTEYILPALSDSLYLNDHIKFHLIDETTPFIINSFNVRGKAAMYYYYLTLGQNTMPPTYTMIDSFDYNDLSQFNIISVGADSVFIKYRHYYGEYRSLAYKALISSDSGKTFGNPTTISEHSYFVTMSFDNYYYAIDFVYRRSGVMYYRLDNLFETATDSSFIGYYYYARGTIDGNGGMYVIVTDANNNTYFLGKDIITHIGTKTDNDVLVSIPIEISVHPNPFNHIATLTFNHSKNEMIDVRIYDITGRLNWEYLGYQTKEGINRIQIDSKSMPSGVYFVKLKFIDQVYSTKMVLIK